MVTDNDNNNDKNDYYGNWPVVTIKIQEPINATDDGMNPDSIATEGSARIPAPTVVPATNEIALNNWLSALSNFEIICSELPAWAILALPRPLTTAADAELLESRRLLVDLVTNPWSNVDWFAHSAKKRKVNFILCD